jgi:hypothetical protein
MLSPRLARNAALAAALLAGATACGSTTAAGKPAAAASPAPSASPTPAALAVDTLTADQISDKAKAAMGALSSLKVDGTMTTEDGKMSIHLAADRQKNCVGTVGIPGVGEIEIRHTGTQTWLKPDTAFWKSIAVKQGNPKAGPVVAELFKGRYLTGGADDPQLKQASEMCGLIEGITSDDSPSKATKGAAGTVDGVRTFSLQVTDDQGQKSTLYIATEGKPYLIRMEQTEGSEPGRMDFSAFDKPVTVQAPPADDVIDYTVFQKKAQSI